MSLQNYEELIFCWVLMAWSGLSGFLVKYFAPESCIFKNLLRTRLSAPNSITSGNRITSVIVKLYGSDNGVVLIAPTLLLASFTRDSIYG